MIDCPGVLKAQRRLFDIWPAQHAQRQSDIEPRPNILRSLLFDALMTRGNDKGLLETVPVHGGLYRVKIGVSTAGLALGARAYSVMVAYVSQ